MITLASRHRGQPADNCALCRSETLAQGHMTTDPAPITTSALELSNYGDQCAEYLIRVLDENRIPHPVNGAG